MLELPNSSPVLARSLLTAGCSIRLFPVLEPKRERLQMQEVNDHVKTLADLKAQVRQFVRERDWEQYHFPKDLAIGLSIEAAELLEHFRFRSNDEIAARLQDPDCLKDIGHELADVLYFVLLMCNNFGLEAAQILEEKLKLSASRYPIDQARGKNLKYTELDTREGSQE